MTDAEKMEKVKKLVDAYKADRGSTWYVRWLEARDLIFKIKALVYQ